MKSTNRRHWFEDAVNDITIKEYLRYTIAYQDEQLSWYKKRQVERRLFSETMLTLALFLFAASFILPLLPGALPNVSKLIDGGKLYAWGYISLITCTMILLGNRLFGHSDNWIRFTLTYLQIDAISSEFHGKWLELVPQMKDAPLSPQVRSTALQLLQKFDVALKDAVKIESENWKELFSNRVQEFAQKADTRLNDLRQEISDFNRANQMGFKSEKTNLKVEVSNIQSDYSVQSKLIKNGEIKYTGILSPTDPTWILTDIDTGNYQIEHTIIHDQKTVKILKDILVIDGKEKIQNIKVILENF